MFNEKWYLHVDAGETPPSLDVFNNTQMPTVNEKSSWVSSSYTHGSGC